MSDLEGKILSILSTLGKEEKKLINDIIKLEKEHLNEKFPQIQSDLLKLVRQVIV